MLLAQAHTCFPIQFNIYSPIVPINYTHLKNINENIKLDNNNKVIHTFPQGRTKQIKKLSRSMSWSD